MNLLRTTAICAFAVFGAASAWAESAKVGAVDVKTDLTAFENSNALDYWPNLTKDLSQAIAEKVEVTGNPEDKRLVVEITGIMLDNNPILPDSGEFNQLDGTVAVETEPGTDSNAEVDTASEKPVNSSALRLYATTGEADSSDSWLIILPSKDDFYNVMVDTYAAEVAERIDEKL